jgi:hypothetical protein
MYMFKILKIIKLRNYFERILILLDMYFKPISLLKDHHIVMHRAHACNSSTQDLEIGKSKI